VRKTPEGEGRGGAGRRRPQVAAQPKLGYAVDNEEHEAGVRCVAAPIRSYSGGVVASLSVSGPATRITSAAIPRLAERVKEFAAKLSAQLGYRA